MLRKRNRPVAKCSPIFVGGLDRSGKTYLRFMLESHPVVVFSKRANLWPRYYQKFDSLTNEDNFRKLFAALKGNKHLAGLNLEYAALWSEVHQGPVTYERVFELIHQKLAHKHGKTCWGDQTEFLENFAVKILRAYPAAKFIQMIRDPRDRFEAILEKPTNHQGLGMATARWIHSAKLAWRLAEEFPDRYLVIRYETMAAAPEKTIRQVCEFVGLQYDPAMALLADVPRFKDAHEPGQDEAISPITTEYIGRFEKHLSPVQVGFIQRFSQPYMQQFGYQPVPTFQPGMRRVLDYLLTWPVHLIELLGSRLLVQMGRV